MAADTFISVQISTTSPPTQQADDLAAMFRLLGDPNRVRILLALLDADELCVHEIADAVATSETKVSQALRLLRTAGVVRNRRDGRHIHYRLDDEHVADILTISRRHLDHVANDDGRPA